MSRLNLGASGIVFFFFSRMHKVDVVVEWNKYGNLGKFREIPASVDRSTLHCTSTDLGTERSDRDRFVIVQIDPQRNGSLYAFLSQTILLQLPIDTELDCPSVKVHIHTDGVALAEWMDVVGQVSGGVAFVLDPPCLARKDHCHPRTTSAV